MKRCDFCGSDQPLTITRLVEHSGVRKPLSEAATHRLPTETRS